MIGFNKTLICIILFTLVPSLHGFTFLPFKILRLFGKEICIVVTNLSHMNVEYFHPKTTPNTPVRKAVQMSMALPGTIFILLPIHKVIL